MTSIDYWLDRITMYRLLLYYLLALVGGAMLLGALGYLPYSPMVIIKETAFLLLACWLINRIFAYLLDVPHNPESSLITALILTLIITPPASQQDYVFLSAAAGLAMASKYLLNIRGKHIFNPAAIAVVLTAWGAGQSASWWVGTTWMAPLVAIGGILLVRKINRGLMVATFFIAAIVTTSIIVILRGGGAGSTLHSTILHSSLLFLGFVMLTEPLTSPTTRNRQLLYALLAGILFAPQVHLFKIYSTPELALIVSNIFAYIISSKTRLLPTLTEKVKWSSAVYDFIFKSDQPLVYEPGQYMEWTLPHEHVDSRGSRRHFTLASSPTETNLRIGVKFYDKSSTFKKALQAMDGQTPISAGQVAGDFTLPKNSKRKLAFIAGGIGITPFRSMVKYLLDNEQKRDINLIYSETKIDNLAYINVFNAARRELGMKSIYTITGSSGKLPEGVRRGKVSSRLIAEEIPDYLERLFYISGPQPMVREVKANLESLGVASRHIKTDYFAGYA